MNYHKQQLVGTVVPTYNNAIVYLVHIVRENRLGWRKSTEE